MERRDRGKLGLKRVEFDTKNCSRVDEVLLRRHQVNFGTQNVVEGPGLPISRNTRLAKNELGPLERCFILRNRKLEFLQAPKRAATSGEILGKQLV